MAASTATTTETLREASTLLREFNEKSDVALETLQPLMQQYVALLRTLRTEVVQLHGRAAGCVQRAKAIAARERVDVGALRLGLHGEELDREEKDEEAQFKKEQAEQQRQAEQAQQ
jgi:hypothetical protein